MRDSRIEVARRRGFVLGHCPKYGGGILSNKGRSPRETVEQDGAKAMNVRSRADQISTTTRLLGRQIRNGSKPAAGDAGFVGTINESCKPKV